MSTTTQNTRPTTPRPRGSARTGGADSAGTTLWSRPRLIGILASAVTVAVLMIGGLGYSVWHLLGDTSDSHGSSGDTHSADAADIATGQTRVHPGLGEPAQGYEHRDEVAAAPMLEVPADAATPDQDGDQGTGPMVGEIDIPTGTDPGPANVLTGFPHTPEGAVGQLAQIDVAVLQAMSLPGTAQVHQAWALPGGADASDWRLTGSVAAFLDAAGMSEVKDPTATVTVTPAGGLIKGTDGPDWVVACVLTRVTAIYQQQAQSSFGHCERMQWAGGRWLIAPGTPPSPAPSTWPGTELATEAGWRTWHSATGPGAGDNHPDEQPDDRY